MNTENRVTSSQRTQKKAAFTLVELLVVVAIVAILAALAFPMLKRSTESAKTVKCLSNLKQLGQATLAYNADNQQNIPPFTIKYPIGGRTFWYLQIRPYLGESKTELDPPPKDSNLPVFYCPSVNRKSGYPHTDYAANTFVFDTTESTQTKAVRIESPSKVVMYSESLSFGSPYPDSDWQFVSSFAKQDPNRFFPHRHRETVNMVFCDGHAQNLPRAEVVANFTNYFGDRELWK